MDWARKINEMGFAITDVMDSSTPHQMRKVYETADKDPTKAENPAEAIACGLKSDEWKAFQYNDENNWAIQIS